MPFGSLAGLVGYGFPQDPDALRNLTPELEAQRWAERMQLQAVQDGRRITRELRKARIAARKARAAEYRKTKPRRRYKDL